MKILWFSHNIPYPPVRGVLLRNYNLIREIASRSELHLVALWQTALCPTREEKEVAEEILSEFCASVRVFPLDWEVSPLSRMGLLACSLLGRTPYDVYRYHSSECHRYLATLRSNRFDVLHVDTLGLVPYRRHFSKVPAVLNHHNIESHMLFRRSEREKRLVHGQILHKMARNLERWERKFAPVFDRNFVVSELDGQRLEDIAPGARIEVVPNGVDTHYFDGPVNTDPAEKSMVFIGGQSWYPNADAMDYLLESIWPLIIREEPEARLVVIGKSPTERCQAAAQSDSRIQVLGFLDDIREQMTRAAVFVCPFREGGGSRLKVLTALSMRKAMVASTVGAEGVRIEPDKHYLLANDPETFARAVLRLFRDVSLRADLGEAGRQAAVQRYDWKQIGLGAYNSYRGLQPEK